jgi:succinate dehydrogenase / fumarate reductase cytochrome b subunit
VADTALVVYRPDLYDHALTLYKSAFFRFGEVAIFFSVLFHALNGLRIIAIDFWEKGPRYQRHMSVAVVTVFVLVMAPGAYFMLEHTVRTLFGSAR